MHLRLLGPPELWANGRAAPLGGSRQRALLALLALRAGEVVPRDRLIEALWGEAPPEGAAHRLDVQVSRLRASMRKAGADAALLETAGGGYRLRLNGWALDVREAERLIEQGRRALAGGLVQEAAETLRAALDLWRGPLLLDLANDPASQTDARRLEELRVSALEDRIEAELALGLHVDLVPELHRLVAEHPLRERLRAELMLALYGVGRQAEALEVYRDARRALVSELGIEPSEALSELERAILNHDASLTAPTIALPDGAPKGEPAAASPPLPARSRRWPVVVAGLLLAALVLVGAVALVGVAGDDDGGVAPLTADSHAVAVIDPDTNEVVQAISVGAGPGQLAYDRQTSSLWVANLDDETVTRIDPGRRRSGRTVAIGNVPDGLAAADGTLWVAGHGRGLGNVNVRKVDERFYTTELSARVGALGPEPTDLALAGGQLWVAPSYGLLTRIDTHTGSHRPIETDHKPMVVAAGAKSVWVADTVLNTVTRVDPASGATTSIPVGNGPAGIALGRGGVWVTLREDDSLTRLDPESGAAGKTIRVGREPGGVATGAGAVWVANSADGTVSRIDPETGQVVATITVGASPEDILVAGGLVWVTVRPNAPEPAAPGGTARIAFAFDPGSLDPALGWAIEPWMVSYATGAKLLTYPDEAGPAGLRLVPEVAASLPHRSPDGRTYTFKIRKGFRFSPPSNEPVTAQTFKYSIERALNRKMHGPGLQFLRDVVGADDYASGRTNTIAGITAQGDTLTFRLAHPSGDFTSRIATPFFTAVPTDTPIDPQAVRTVPGAGPYYVAFHSRKTIVLRPNPNYRGPRPHRLREIRIAIGVGQHRALRAIEAGAADYAAPSVSDSDASRLAHHYGPASDSARAGRQRYFVNPSLGLDYLTMNTSRDLFSSVRMRRAVNYAIDRRALGRAGASNGGDETPTDQYLPPGMPGFRDARIYPLRPGVDKARRLAGPGPGHRTAVLYAPDGAADQRHAQIVKTNLKAIGIDVHIKVLSHAVLFQRLGRKGEPYDLALTRWYADYADPVTFLGFFDPRQGPANPNQSTNDSYFDEPGYTRRLAAAERLPPPKRYVAYGRLESDLARNAAPWAAIGNPVAQDFFSERIGCQLFHPLYGIDLTALCIRR